MANWVTDFIDNTKNAISDVQAIGKALTPPTSAPQQPARPYVPTIGGMSTTTIAWGVGALILGALIWKKIS